MRINGMTVKLHQKTEVDRDSFGAPIYWDDIVEVDDVLVSLPSAEERINEQNLTGKRIEYTLGIPKGDTHDWENQIVEFFDQEFKTFGLPEQGIEANIPLRWNKKVKCERIQ